MAPATYLPRTYSRKSSVKRKRGAELGGDVERSDVTTKRRKKFRAEEVLSEQESMQESDRRKGVRTYGSSVKKKRKPGASNKPSSTADNLSDMFESESPVGTPIKLAKRMLARSKTESSLETSPPRVIERTPSLPTLPSTPSRDKGKRKEVELEGTLNTLLPLPRPPSNVTRTYADRSRSFLVAIPASSLGPNSALLPPGVNVTIGEEEDDYLNRESYSSLRARWGVDNSEDDPYPVDSPGSASKRHSRSTTGTPSGSPSRSGRGGKKGGIQSVPLPPGMMNPLKSITELRSKGENRRFMDELGYMFEGMDKKCVSSLRRTSALDIVTKLCDVEFARKAKATDIFGRIWDIFIDAGAGQNEDKILDLLLAFLAALIARDGTSLTELAQRPSGSKAEGSKRYASFVDTLFSVLASCISSSTSDLLQLVEAGDIELKRAGMSKKDRSQITLIYDVIASKSHLFRRGTAITTPLLITYTLNHLPPALIPSRHLAILFASLRVSLSPLVSSTSSSSKPSSRSSLSKASSKHVASHVSWRDLIPRIGFEYVNAHLQLLDTYLLGQWQASGESNDDEGDQNQKDGADELEQARDEWLLDALVALGVCAEMRLRSQGKGSEKAGECLELVLRIFVSRTHAEESWCRAVLENPCSAAFLMRLVAWAGDTYYTLRKKGEEGVKQEEGNGDDGDTETVISEEELGDAEYLDDSRSGSREDEEIRWQDRLCLALGLLANLTQAVDEAKDIVRETRFDPNCSLKKSTCIQSCYCARSIGGLDILVRLYAQQEGSSPRNKSKAEGLGEDGMLDMISLPGHLAVLFGLLMRENQENTEIIVAALPSKAKGESGKAKLARLVEQARALVSFDAALSGDEWVARDVVIDLEKLVDGS